MKIISMVMTIVGSQLLSYAFGLPFTKYVAMIAGLALLIAAYDVWDKS